ncbi:MAG TPA: hypothetical protein DCZ92_03785 [Elusimicrobia bacterium]|nr:MAG: hypothetical protein A2016_01320 [Elusimicrobia bacterium GWF2_62_30]HBA59939.1 hypothetical protein [Elusimicrobiota bacterium]
MHAKDPLIFKALEIRESRGLDISLSPPLEFYADAFTEPGTLKSLKVTLSFSVGGDELLLTGRTDAELALRCARCDAPIARRLSDTFDEAYPDSVEYIDTRDIIRETVALLAPLKVLCSETCKGRCPLCGVDRNATPCTCSMDKATPFEALKGLKIRKPDDKGRKQ